MTPSVRVEGDVVIAGTGEPCRDGSVRLANDDERVEAGVDTQGHVVLRGLSAGTYRVSVDCRGYRSRRAAPVELDDRNIGGFRWEVHEPTLMRAHNDGFATNTVSELRLLAESINADDGDDATARAEDEVKNRSDRAAIRGRVLDDKTGQPIPEVVLEATWDSFILFSRRSGTFTGDNGEFHFENLPVKPITLSVVNKRDSWLRRPVRCVVIGADDSCYRIPVEAGDQLEVEVRSKDYGGTIQGILVDERGVPVADAIVFAKSFYGEPLPKDWRKNRIGQYMVRPGPARTDQNGYFELTGLPHDDFVGVEDIQTVRQGSSG